jgi:hypothetical protein
MFAAAKIPTEQIEIMCNGTTKFFSHLINPAPVFLVNVFCVV